QRPCWLIDRELRLRHGKAEATLIAGLQDYAARAGWVRGSLAREGQDAGAVLFRAREGGAPYAASGRQINAGGNLRRGRYATVKPRLQRVLCPAREAMRDRAAINASQTAAAAIRPPDIANRSFVTPR